MGKHPEWDVSPSQDTVDTHILSHMHSKPGAAHYGLASRRETENPKEIHTEKKRKQAQDWTWDRDNYADTNTEYKTSKL